MWALFEVVLTDPARQPNSGTVTLVTPITADFAAVYRAEVQHMLRILRRLGVRERDLEDVAHDVFLAAYRRWNEYDPNRAARPWLYGFAYRIAADHRRLFRHRYEIEEEADVVVEVPLQDEQLAEEQARRLLLQALDSVEYERRGIFVMHDLDGVPMPEIAGTLGIPLNTAYSRLRLARRDLENAVRRAQETPSLGGRS